MTEHRLENVMREYAPPLVTGVRVGSLDIGTNSMRLISFKCLPPDADIGNPTMAKVEEDTALSHVARPP